MGTNNSWAETVLLPHPLKEQIKGYQPDYNCTALRKKKKKPKYRPEPKYSKPQTERNGVLAT